MHHFRSKLKFLTHEPEFRGELDRLARIDAQKLHKGRSKTYELALTEETDIQVLLRPNREFDFANVVELRRGIASQEIMDQLDTVDADAVLSIFYTVPKTDRTKSLNLAFEDKAACDYYYAKLVAIRRKLQGSGEVFILSRMWKRHATDGVLKVRQAMALLEQVNVTVSALRMRALLKEYDEDGDSSTLSFPEFVRLIRTLRHHAVLSEAFAAYAGPGQSQLSVDAVKAFFEAQHEPVGPSEELCELSETEFQTMVVHRMGLTRQRELDESRPLSDYLCHSSHNTYLATTDQLAGQSSIEMYAVSGKLGVRCVELDVWDGDAAGPIVHHGYTLVTRLLLRDVLLTLNRHAFETSPHALVLSIENHCSMEQQDIMAEQLERLLGDAIYRPGGDGSGPLPTLAALRGKYVIKAKLSKHDGDRNVPVVSDRFRALIALPIGEYRSTDECAAWPPTTMANVSENLAADLPLDFLRRFADGHLARVYPKGTRVDSSNFNPLPFWKGWGAQICAMNLQHFGRENFVNFGFFSQTGHAGYVQVDRSAEPAPGVRLQLRIHGARNIPVSQRDIIDPYIVVYVVTAAGELPDSRQRTKSVVNNGLNPDFGFDYSIDVPDPRWSVLVFELWDDDVGRDDLVAFYAAPVDCLAQGFRAAPLYGRRLYPVNRGLAHVLVTCQTE